MRILLDTHTLFWWVTDDPKLSVAARRAIEDEQNDVLVSAATACEMATKVRLGKWAAAAGLISELDSILEANRFEPFAVNLHHGRLAGLLAGKHGDPFDRMLAAQCQLESLPLVSADPVFLTFGVRVLW